MQETLFERPKFSGGGTCPQTPLVNSCLRMRYSAHTVGNCIVSVGGGQGKWALSQFCPTTGESLRNALPVS
jgi:hypothetical protein